MKKKMSNKDLVKALEDIQTRQETDRTGRYYQRDAHEDADQLLLDFIDDPEVTNAFYHIDKWYA